MILAEPDVALTDLGLALESGAFAVILDRTRPVGRHFTLFFAATATASVLGGAVHGFFPDPASPASHALWRAALLAIGVAALGACAAAAHLGLREGVARRVVRIATLELAVYAAIVLSGDRPFAVAVCEYLPAALFLLAVLIARFARRREGAVLVGAAGLGLTFVASGLQQAGVGLHPRWFNHNALYHLLEGIALAIHRREVPQNLLDHKIFALDMGALLAGTKFRGQFEEHLLEGIALATLYWCARALDRRT